MNLSVNNKLHFTNIVLLYDIVCIFLTNKSFSKNVKLTGYELKTFTKRRMPENEINENFTLLKGFLYKIITSIPSLNNFFTNNIQVNRTNNSTSLLFRPMGQLILYYVLKVAKDNRKLNKAITFFAQDTFNIRNSVWKKVFIDPESNTLKTDKPRQLLAIQLILANIGINIQMTQKEKQFYQNFNIDPRDL
jgi:hypothetical protein